MTELREVPGRLWRVLLPATLLIVGVSTTPARAKPLEAVPHVELSRYVGTWYEIASFPQRFQRGCTGTVATYTIRPDGAIDVVNRCARDSLNGRITIAKGKARVVDAATNAKLKVTFFWPFWGDYWIIDLGHDYEFAVVGHPNRKYLWILSRTPSMPTDVYEEIIGRLRAQGYDTARLMRTVQLKVTGG